MDSSGVTISAGEATRAVALSGATVTSLLLASSASPVEAPAAAVVFARAASVAVA